MANKIRPQRRTDLMSTVRTSSALLVASVLALVLEWWPR